MRNFHAVVVAATAGASAPLVLTAALGAPSSESVAPILRARAVELVDQRGTVRAALTVEPNDDVILRMRDSTGTIRLKMGASAKGSALVLLDSDVEPGVHLRAERPESTLTIRDKGGHPRPLQPAPEK